MKPITAIIIDDERHARESLSSLLQLYCSEIQVISLAENIEQGKSTIESLRPQIVFLDIDIGNQTGFELLKNLKYKDFKLIFTTAHSEFALEAFRANAIDYLLKPIEPELLKIAVAKAKKGISSKNNNFQELLNSLKKEPPQKITISTSEGISFIQIEQITHISGSGNYSTFYLNSGEKILASKGLKHFEGILPVDLFFRSHQSHMVNKSYIKSIVDSGSTIRLTSGSLIPVSKSKKIGLLESLC